MDHQPHNQPARWQRMLTPVRWIVTGSLVGYLIWQANPLEIWQSLLTVDLPLLLLALVLQFIGIAISAAKWGMLLRARGHRLPYGWLLNAYLVGQFANNFLPTTIGGDALRAVQLRRRIGSLTQASASIFLERLTGFLALSLIVCLALLVAYVQVTGTPLVTDPFWLVVTVGFSLLAVGAAVLSFFAPLILQLFGAYLPAVALRPMERVAAALASYFPQGRTLLGVVLMSLLFQSLWVVIHAVCGMALGIDAPLLLYALMVPISDILGLVPVFVNNVGAREIAFTVYLTQVGVSQATALALAFLIFAVRLVVSLLGGVVVFFGGADLRITADTEPSPPAASGGSPSEPISSEAP
ncbi:MAG: flippase-like domain-containing protein [Chloroflexaceae bacterium]|nr:flippase-like domain-containing protein [Chloroflexaceae bacterium]NJO05351.1 flippase-like domain-containing protein [Chloroflexaceae bacterium]